jgi:hypothetical protein
VTLVELGDSGEHLADQRPRRIVGGAREVETVRGDHLRAGLGELVENHLGDHEVAREAIRAFHNHHFHAVALDAVEERREAGAAVEVLRTADAFVAELLEDVVLRGFAKLRNRCPLPGEPVAVHLPLATHAKIA